LKPQCILIARCL